MPCPHKYEKVFRSGTLVLVFYNFASVRVKIDLGMLLFGQIKR
jgi:hypothetical protein